MPAPRSFTILAYKASWGPGARTQFLGGGLESRLFPWPAWHILVRSDKTEPQEGCWHADTFPFTWDSGWFQDSGLLTVYYWLLGLNYMWGSVGWFPLSFYHPDTSSLQNPKVARGFSECASLPASRVLTPSYHQAVLGEHAYCLCGETGAMQSQQALQLTYFFLLIDVVMFYPPWPILNCAKQQADIPCENETILFTPPMGLLPIVPVSCGIGSQGNWTLKEITL